MNNHNEIIRVFNNNKTIPDIIGNIIEEGTEDSFYVCDIGDIIEKYYLWKSVMPNITPFYAVKCNNHETILKILAALGAGFDCASKAEIDQVLSLNVDPSRIVYAHPTKPAGHIRYAASVGVKTMTFDSDAELYKIKTLCPDANTIIRIKSATRKAVIKLDLKFGCYADTEAVHLLSIARKLKINVIGLSFHIGFGCQDSEAFKNTISIARNIFDVAASLGYKFKILDLGGGYPRSQDEFLKISNVITTSLKANFNDLPINIIAEPGQFISGTALTLACNITSTKRIAAYFEQAYYINEGIYGGFRGPFDLGIPVTVYPLKKSSNSLMYPTTLFGPTCSSTDTITDNIMMPKMHAGDWLIFKNMGAYTVVTASSFNGFSCGNVVNVINSQYWRKLQEELPHLTENLATKLLDSHNKDVNADERDSVTFYIANMNIHYKD